MKEIRDNEMTEGNKRETKGQKSEICTSKKIKEKKKIKLIIKKNSS